jgi:hypothetical protein
MRNQLFTQVAMKTPKESTFDLTHDVKMSGKMGQLMPCCAFDVLPGDSIQLGADALIRLAPILAPIMHRVDFTIHYFFVPNRLLWPNWPEFISGTPDGNNNPYIPPYVVLDSNGVTTPTPEFIQISDYLGIPYVANTNAENVSALPYAAYNLIYNEYYRDQNLILPIPDVATVALPDGDVTAQMMPDTKLRYRAWEHDYFTSCLPFAQKGAAVDLPLGNVVLDPNWDSTINQPIFRDDTGSLSSGAVDNSSSIGGAISVGGGSIVQAYDPEGTLLVGSTTINDLRRAYRLQEWLEKNARGGTRYTEQILVHFGVKSPDARLQRPEYITGVKAPVIVTEVLNNTGPTDFFNGESGNVEQTGSAQGAMTGHAAGVTQGRLGRYYAQEHGWIIGIISIMPKTAYQQGIHKMFTRTDYLDYAFPTFANLGEQEVLKREIYAYTSASNDLFGYIPRYAEYKFMNSRVAGDFKTTLDYWHLGRIFNSAPNLSEEFIECTPADVERIFAVQDETDNVWMHILNKIKARRKLPFFGTPTI